MIGKGCTYGKNKNRAYTYNNCFSVVHLFKLKSFKYQKNFLIKGFYQVFGYF